METASRRPWENGGPTSQAQTLPSISTLTSKLPPAGERQHPNLTINPPQRDSDTWMSSNSAMTSSSGHSANTMPYLNSAHSPASQGPSAYTPDTTPGSTFGPSAAQKQQNGYTPENSGPNRGSGDYDESRRSSVTGGIHQGMSNLGLGPTSPYHSNNQSQSSIVSGLQQQRGIPTGNGYNSSRYSTTSGGPLSPYSSNRSSRAGNFAAGRVAPPILENPKADVYSAEAPTRGQAYAFPDPDGSRPGLPGRPPSTFSRRNSFAESFTSSIMTMESSRLPVGQHELPDSHHHSLMSKHIDNLRGEPDSPNSTTPYSRTPELRVTHKLAERKRRSEMKDCFEQLRTRLPTAQSNKSSKWETLSRAIDYITSLENTVKQQRIDADKQHRHLQDMELKLQQMNEQLQRLPQHGSYPAPPNAMPQSPYGSHYTNGIESSNEPQRTLPPLTNGAMQGVQYADDRR